MLPEEIYHHKDVGLNLAKALYFRFRSNTSTQHYSIAFFAKTSKIIQLIDSFPLSMKNIINWRPSGTQEFPIFYYK